MLPAPDVCVCARASIFIPPGPCTWPGGLQRGRRKQSVQAGCKEAGANSQIEDLKKLSSHVMVKLRADNVICDFTRRAANSWLPLSLCCPEVSMSAAPRSCPMRDYDAHLQLIKCLRDGAVPLVC